jgi:methyltransferase (TIGR00027 family)
MALSGASQTAGLMAVQRALESCHPPQQRLFFDPLAPLFVSRPWRAALVAAQIGSVRRLLERLYDFRGGPGPRASAAARTRLIDDLVEDQAPTASQLLILGAGYDSRAYRLQTLADRVVFEVDHPATQAAKRAALARLGTKPVASIVYVPVDFEHDDLEAALSATGYDTSTRSIVLWEGVTNYLTADAVESTLAAILALAAPGSALIFTYVDQDALDRGEAAFPEAKRWLQGVRRRGEPWTFGLQPDTLAAYLASRGFTLTSDVTTAQAGARYFPPRGRREQGSRLYHVATATPAQPTS